MLYAKLTPPKTSRDMVDAFRGYNHNLRIGSGEFYDMKNLTSDYYPVLSPRKKRGFYVKPASPQGLISKAEVCYVDGTEFVIGETRLDMGLSVADEDCPKQLVSMGAYVIILPDKKYVNTMDTEDRGSIEASYTSSGTVQFTMCTATAEDYEGMTVSTAAPSNPENGKLWVDSSAQPHTLKKYDGASGMWVSIATTYIKISAEGIGRGFNVYDGITVSGVQAEGLQDLNATMTVWAKGDDYLVVTGILDTAQEQEESITVTRSMPKMDYLVESNNRLWGCRYGTAMNGDVVNEIYACKLGDFKNWNCFMGLSTDSYAASCGTDGPFTGAIAHLGYPLFWKENCVHKVFGNYPANFQIQTTECRGVQQGCHKSLAIVNEILYYKARTGICAFDGSLPVDASYALGNVRYDQAVAGAHGNKYYVSMADASGNWHLFVYDTQKGLWHREDDLHAGDWCSHEGELYCLDVENMNIITMFGSGTPDADPVEWMAETGELGLNSPDMKYISRIILRLRMDMGSVMTVYAQYDMSEEWVEVAHIRGTSLRSFSIPIRPRRCDFMRLRFVCKGDSKIYALTKTIEQGSDLS